MLDGSDVSGWAGQDSGSLAEQVVGLAGLGEDADGNIETLRRVADDLQVGVETSEDQDAAVGKLATDFVEQRDAILAGHRDVAEQEVGLEFARALHGIVSGVDRPGLKPAFAQNQSQGIRDHPLIIDNQDTLHSASFVRQAADMNGQWIK